MLVRWRSGSHSCPRQHTTEPLPTDEAATLLDLSPFAGLDQHTVSVLVAIFFDTADRIGTATQQLDTIDPGISNGD